MLPPEPAQDSSIRPKLDFQERIAGSGDGRGSSQRFIK